MTSLYIQLFGNNYLRRRIGSMLNRSAREKDRVTPRVPYYPNMHTLTRPFLNRMYMYIRRTFLPKHVFFLSVFYQ